MQLLKTLTSNGYVFAVIILTGLLLYLTIAHLVLTRRRPPSSSEPKPPADRQEDIAGQQHYLPDRSPAAPPASTTLPEDPALIEAQIAENLDKNLAGKGGSPFNKAALLKKLLQSDRFKG